jgi:hypothetical protein
VNYVLKGSCSNAQFVALSDESRTLYPFTVHENLSSVDSGYGEGARLVEARGPQPFVDSNTFTACHFPKLQ